VLQWQVRSYEYTGTAWCRHGQAIKHFFSEPSPVWWFGSHGFGLQSPEEGLTGDQALSWLKMT